MGPSTFDELQEIRRGRGMQASDIAVKIGPGLRAACGVTATDSPAIVRRKVGSRIIELCERLPEDLKISVLAGLALLPEANRDHPRAAVRRMRMGFRILAEQLDDLVADPALRQGWHVGSLRVLLRMDVDPPQVVEDRTIVADTDDLTEIEVRFSAPASGSQTDSPITAAIIYGGEITSSERVTPSHTKYAMRLPAPLGVGEQHEYGARFSAYPRALMPPYYVLTPLQPCERFTVRVRFGADVPANVWRLDGIPPRAIDGFEPPNGLLTPDRLGEVSLEFSRLHQGLSYGMRWSSP